MQTKGLLETVGAPRKRKAGTSPSLLLYTLALCLVLFFSILLLSHVFVSSLLSHISSPRLLVFPPPLSQFFPSFLPHHTQVLEIQHVLNLFSLNSLQFLLFLAEEVGYCSHRNHEDDTHKGENWLKDFADGKY